MAFIDQVQDLTSITASDTDELSQFLKDGVLDVTNKWLAVRPQDIDLFARESAETTSNASLNLNGARIISVIREDGVTSNNWRPCRKISPAQQYLVTDTESLSFASKINPAYMVGDAGKISVFPAPGSDPNAFKAYYVNKDPVNSSGSALIHSHDDILYFPIDKVYLVVMYAGIKLIHATLAAKSAPVVPVLLDVPTLSITATTPTAISLATVSYTDAANADASATAVSPITVATVSKADISGDVPTYTKPTMVLGAAPTISDLSISAVQPVAPALTSVTFTSIDSALDASASVFTTATVSSASTYTGSAPAYSKPTIVLGTAPTISNLSITAVPPDSPTLSESSVTITGVVPDYTAPVFTSASTYLTEMEAGTIGAAASDIDLEHWFSIAGQIIEDEEDTELAQVHLQKIATFLSAFQADMQNQLNVFNEANVVYQATLQKDLKDADFDNQEDARLVQKYQAELSVYQAEVNAQVQEYQQNLAGDIQVWQAERSTDLQKYGSDIQNELNEFNKENVAYQSAIQESIQELQVANQVNLAKAQADLQLAISNEDRDQQRQLQNGINDMKAIVDDNGRKIAIYQAEAGIYQAEIGKEVQEYQQNLAGDLQVWQAERQTDLQKYASDIQNELNEYNKENVRYQANVQAELAKHNSDLQKAMTQAQLDAADAQQEATQTTNIDQFNKAQDQALDLANRAKQIEDDISNNSSKVAQFSAEAQHYATQVNEDVQKYTAQVQALSADAQASVAQHGAELQGTQAEYQWLQDQYTRLKAEYDQAFMIAAPQQQAAPQAARG